MINLHYSQAPYVSGLLYFLLLPLCLSASVFLLHVHTYLSHNILYAFTKSFFLHLWVFCHNAAHWQRAEALVSQRQLSACIAFKQWRVEKNRLRHPVGTMQANGSNKTRQGRLRQTQKAWKVYEKGAGGSRDERRQVSQRSTVPLTSMQLDFCFYQHNWMQSKYVGEKGLFGVDIRNHSLCWQPCMQWQHQSLFLLNQCFHAMF